MDISLEIDIRQPIDTVFRYATSWQTLGEWVQPAPTLMPHDGPAEGIGSTYWQSQQFGGYEVCSEVQIVEYMPPRLVTYRTLSGPIPYELTLTFCPIPGGTHATYRMVGDLGGFLSQIAEPMLKGYLERSFAAGWELMKGLLEA